MSTIEIPPLLLQFIVTLVAAFVLGLELHQSRRAQSGPDQGSNLGFGTTRTLTLTAMVGFALFFIGALPAFLTGLAVIAFWLGIEYSYRLNSGHDKRLLTRVLMIVTYCIGPLVMISPPWFVALYVVSALLLLGEKPQIRRLSDVFRYDEGARLAKFLLMAGLVLPLLPKTQIHALVPVTWYAMWLAMIAVSGMSYVSYLIQTYFLPNRGLLLTGLLGGLYSSTAATIVLARRCATNGQASSALYSPPIILATAMMYLRLWVIVYALGHHDAALQLALPFGLLILLALGVAFWVHRQGNHQETESTNAIRHPLEINTALLFALFFTFFAGLTQWVTQAFGEEGLNILAAIVGLSDIDPFILSILAGTYSISDTAIVGAILIASGSNNLIKALYAFTLARNAAVLPAVIALASSFVLSVGYALLH